MHIAILATHLTEEQNRLKAAAIERGHTAEILEVQKFGLTICMEAPEIYYKGEPIKDKFDAVIPRIDIPFTDFGFKVLRQFQAIGVYTTDTAYALELARNKLRCFQYLTKREVAVPKTGFAYTAEGYKEVLATMGEGPYIVKLNEGTQGMGVFLAEDDKQAENFLGTFSQLNTEVMVQEFIGEFAGTDIRVYVVGDKIIGAMKRKSQDDDFRANISLGGHSTEVELTKEEFDLALKASRAVNMNISGIDIIRSNRGPLIIEINTAPDFCGEYGIDEVANVNAAGSMIEYAEEGFAKYEKGEGIWLEAQSNFR